MKHKYTGTVYLLCMYALSATAQEVAAPPPANALSSIGNTITSGEPGVRFESMEVRGTAYLFEDFLNGNVHLQDGRTISGQAAFNVDGTDKGGIVVLLPNGNVIDVKEELVKRLEVKDDDISRSFMPIRSSVITGKGQGYWIGEVLYEDEQHTFMKRHLKILKMAEQATPYANAQKYHEYLDEIEYYLRVNNAWSRIRLTKASLVSTAPDLGSHLRNPVTEESIIRALSEGEKGR